MRRPGQVSPVNLGWAFGVPIPIEVHGHVTVGASRRRTPTPLPGLGEQHTRPAILAMGAPRRHLGHHVTAMITTAAHHDQGQPSHRCDADPMSPMDPFTGGAWHMHVCGTCSSGCLGNASVQYCFQARIPFDESIPFPTPPVSGDPRTSVAGDFGNVGSLDNGRNGTVSTQTDSARI